MQDIVIEGDRSGHTPAKRSSAREALSLALDGSAPDNAALHFEAYRLARQLNYARWAHVIDALNAAPDGAVCVVGDGADGIGQLLRAAGVRCTRRQEWSEAVEDAAIVCLGCPRAAVGFDNAYLLDFMWRGGLLITSDHAASMLAARGLLPLAGRGAPRRARAQRQAQPTKRCCRRSSCRRATIDLRHFRKLLAGRCAWTP